MINEFHITIKVKSSENFHLSDKQECPDDNNDESEKWLHKPLGSDNRLQLCLILKT